MNVAAVLSKYWSNNADENQFQQWQQKSGRVTTRISYFSSVWATKKNSFSSFASIQPLCNWLVAHRSLGPWVHAYFIHLKASAIGFCDLVECPIEKSFTFTNDIRAVFLLTLPIWIIGFVDRVKFCIVGNLLRFIGRYLQKNKKYSRINNLLLFLK